MIPVFLSLILVAAVRGQTTDIICYVTVSPVPEGQPVEIVCEYPTDFLARKKTILVLHNTTTVLTCEDVEGDYRCNPAPGYYMSGSLINGEVRLLIPHATKQHEGNYICQGKDLSSSFCELKVEEIPFDTDCTIKRTHTGADIIFFFNKDLRLVNATLFIYKQPFHPERNATIVLYCLVRDYQAAKCDIDIGGYSFDSTRMTLHIQAPSEEDEGRYTVKVPSSLPGISTPCDLILPTDKPSPSTTDEKPTSYTITTQTTQPPVPSNGADTSQQSTTFHIVIIVLLVLILVLVLVLIIGVIVFYRRNQLFSRAQHNTGTATVRYAPVQPERGNSGAEIKIKHDDAQPDADPAVPLVSKQT